MQKKELKKIGQILFMTVCVCVFISKQNYNNKLHKLTGRENESPASLPAAAPPS